MIPLRERPIRFLSRLASRLNRRAAQRTALGGSVLCVGLAVSTFAEDPNRVPRTPLLAPRPATRVTIKSPTVRRVAVPASAEAFDDPPRDPSAKPAIEDKGPAILESPRGRTGPSTPGTALQPAGQTPAVAEPERLSDPGVASVRRINSVPPAESVDGPLGTGGDEGRISLGDDGPGQQAMRTGGLTDADPAGDAPQVRGPAVPADPVELETLGDRLPVKPYDPLAEACDEAIRITSARLLTGESRQTQSNSPWQIGHGLMALREDYTVIADGRRVRALDWLSTGPKFKGEPWFVRGRYGPKAHEYSGTMYDFEGHPNQILAFLAMSDLPQTFVLRDGGGRPFTIADWIETAKREVRLNRNEEVTWTLWAFSVYLDSETQWVNARREPWSMTRLVQEEVKTEPNKHACGGTHGLYALASARNARLQEGYRLRGHWLLAHEKVNRYITLTRSLQNPDGSFSDRYFKGRSHQRNLVKRIGSSGHTLEFLMMALPQSELDAAWVRAGVGRVANDLIAGRNAEVGGKAVGGMYHAVHALKLYRERTGDDVSAQRLQTAEGPRTGVIR
ncbi:MAG: hypothetical protein AAF907_00610 [Planctomycetota bacterium]